MCCWIDLPVTCASAWGAGCNINDITGWLLNERNGVLTLQGSSGASELAWAYSGGSFTVSGGSFASDALGIRCQYNAGYAVIPPDIQQAVLVTTQAMIYDLQIVHVYQRETVREWTGELAGPRFSSIPEAAMRILNLGGWRAFRTR